ncbi:MAG: flippase-like domain-containing protein [Candidatus Hydrogenedens sp.]|jgi:uncharacterized protein (TIRG00374 family)|nr:flippase-like domain-containing protein [Candidatus Hydrogenedens sp.]
MSKKQGWKKLLFWVRIIVLILSLALLLRMVNFALVLKHVGDIPWYIFALLLVIAIIRTWLNGLRWQLVNPDATEQLSQWQYFRFLMIAHAFNLIMPGALGGDFVKTAMTMKTVKSNRVSNLIAIVVDRYIGLFSIIMLGSLALIFATKIPDRMVFYRYFGVLLGGFATATFISTQPRLLALLEKIFRRLGRPGVALNSLLDTWRGALAYFRTYYFRVFFALLLCVPIHGVVFVTKYTVARYLGIEISFFDICAIQALVWIITAVPITISGAGVRELTLIYFLGFYGVEAEPAAALSVYSYILSVILGFVGFMFLFDPHGTIKKISQEESPVSAEHSDKK